MMRDKLVKWKISINQDWLTILCQEDDRTVNYISVDMKQIPQGDFYREVKSRVKCQEPDIRDMSVAERYFKNKETDRAKKRKGMGRY